LNENREPHAAAESSAQCHGGSSIGIRRDNRQDACGRGVSDGFPRNKLLIAHTHPGLDITARQQAVAGLVDRLGREAARDVVAQPRPGGVGKGIFYNSDFKTNWGLGTSFSCDFVCPALPGGNVNTWLYLTASNRSGLGVEAFVSYNGQDMPHFRVFDWARTDPWQTDIPFTSLDNYLTTTSAHGYLCPVLPVWNGTWAINANQYRNQALLYNHARDGWDLVYQYDYAATDGRAAEDGLGRLLGPDCRDLPVTLCPNQPNGSARRAADQFRQ
jgi:hypothetical protein